MPFKALSPKNRVDNIGDNKMTSMSFVIARYDYTPSGHCLYTSNGFLREINHCYNRKFKDLKRAVNFANKKMNKRFYYLIDGSEVHDLEHVNKNIEMYSSIAKNSILFNKG